MTDLADASKLKPGRPRRGVMDGGNVSHSRMRLLTESELDGNCKGWDGKTTFRLCNGEVWQQSAFRVRCLHLASPAVRVWRIGGASLLEFEGVRELLPVERRAGPAAD
ncbi:hypothetical protein [Pseudoduganella namucuonensis]|uniref:Uncharacterized protein n=1 Tax=Pseudoduganella namucuonensis TaxID=1035707 RepID=A0A1I7M098_9BURK|nr:hypothetical protein [Pseudoduganella namucuonensis]SFV15336.1 hypothetical protein SAMN05216552_104558 [Pseudoduganella namucuonensis]